MSVLLTSRSHDSGTVGRKKRCAQCDCKIWPNNVSLYCPSCNRGGLNFCATCIGGFDHCKDMHHELYKCSDPSLIYVSPTRADIILYLDAEAERKDIDLNQGTKSDIIAGSAERAGDNFILAWLFLQHFPHSETRKNTKQHFLESPKPLRACYRDTISQIVKQDYPTNRELGLRVLYFVSRSRRPLTVDELRHLLAVQPGMTDVDEDDPYSAVKLRSVTADLIAIKDDEGKGEVQFFNDTVGDFLLSFDI